MMRRPMTPPIVPPMAATPMNCVSRAGGNPTANRDARIPDRTPRIPSALPWRAVT